MAPAPRNGTKKQNFGIAIIKAIPRNHICLRPIAGFCSSDIEIKNVTDYKSPDFEKYRSQQQMISSRTIFYDAITF
jgi:hypothetical protein